MNTFLQIALGLIPVGIAFVLLAIFRKPLRLVSIITAGFLGCSMCAATVASFVVQPKASAKVAEVDIEKQLALVYAVAGDESGIAQAMQMLTKLRKTAEDSGELTMCGAYLCAAQGDWQSARILYKKAVSMGEKADTAFAKSCDEAMTFAMQPMSQQWTAEESALGKLRQIAVEGLQRLGQKAGGATAEAAQVLLRAQTLFENYRLYDSADSYEAGILAEELEAAVKKDKQLLQLEEIRNCRTTLWVMSAQYSKVAENIGEDSTFEELAVAAELYISGMIRDGDFNKDFIGSYKDMASAVAKQLRVVQSNVDDRDDRDQVSALREELSEKDPTALGILSDRITGYTVDGSNADKPKAHIQLAKIAYETDKDADAKLHLSAAMGSAGASDDQAFYHPLQNVSRIVNEKADYSELKNLSGYVDQMIQNTADPVSVGLIRDYNEYYGPAPDVDPETGEDVKTATFETFVADSLNQFRISIDITHVDATSFPTVVATVNVDSNLATTPEKLKELLQVTDCGVEITDFTVTKSEFAKASIVLCCDVSGSMDGQPIRDLREAVKLFAQTASEKEELALVSFSNGSSVICAFGTGSDAVAQEAESLYAWGGTNMYGAVIDSLQLFDPDDGGLKYILLLSDGEDNTIRSASEINANIGSPAMTNGIVVYSLGIGSSVDLEYLSTIAGSTGGDFVYVEDSASLQTFYDSLRSQMLNQYFITFEAKDTLMAERDLQITLKEADASFTDTAYYTLDRAGAAPTYREDSIISLPTKGTDKGVYGLDRNVIFKSSSPTTVYIKGYGFAADDSVSVKLDGGIDHDAKVTFVDSETLQVQLPGNMAPDTYDVRISIGSMSTVLRNGITVIVQSARQLTEIGPYKFTSYGKIESGDLTTLSGMVQLNSWLNFRGDITLQSNAWDLREFVMTDSSGAYVTFHEDSAKGLAKLMAKCDIKMPIPALGQITLIGENLIDPNSDEYPVRATALPMLNISQVVAIETPGISLYPYKLSVRSDAFTTAIPGQEKLLSAIGGENLFSFKLAIGGSVSNDSIDIYAKYERDADKDSYLSNWRNANFGMVDLFLTTADTEVLIDTANAHVKLDFFANLGFMISEDKKDKDGLGLMLEWKGRDSDTGIQFLWPSAVELKAKFDIPGQIGPVPVTYSDFMIGVENFDPNKWYNATLKGGCSISTKKLSTLVPGLEKFIDDPSILSIDPAEVSLCLGEPMIKLDATVKLLEKMEMANATIAAGKVPVNSELLGFKDDKAWGLYASLAIGPKLELENCTIDVQGACALHLHQKFMGVEMNGHADVKITWSIWEVVDWHKRGMVAVGLQRVEDMPTFVIRIAASDENGSSGYYLMWNEKSNLKAGTLEL